MICFYHELLELPILRKWDTGIHLDCFNSCVEIFLDGKKSVGEGCIRRFALSTDPVFPIRVAFIEGPLHESIELFCEKA